MSTLRTLSEKLINGRVCASFLAKEWVLMVSWMMPSPGPTIELWVQLARGLFKCKCWASFPLVLTTRSVKDIAIAFGFDESLLIPPANKRTRAQQAIANTQHIGLMLRQGHAAQVGAQQQHGLAPEVRASPAAPVPPTPVPAQVAVPVTPGNGQQVIYEVQPPQTPVPNRRRLPPVVPLRLLLHLSLLLLAHQT